MERKQRMDNFDKDAESRKWLNRNVAAMGFTSLFSDTSHEMATSVLPSFLITLVGTVEAPVLLGLISGLSDVSSSFVKTFSGWFSDKVSKRKPIIVLGYLLTGVFVGLIGFAKSWIDVLVYRVLAWMGRGTREPPRDALLADSVGESDYGHAFGFHRAMDTLGAITGPMLALVFISLIGFRNVFFMSFIPGIIAVLIVALGVKEIARKPSIGRKMIGDIKSLPRGFKIFLLIMLLFGIGNFNRTLLLLRAQEVFAPTYGLVVASSMTVLFYAVRNIAQAIADYGVGAFSDKFGKKIPLAFLGFFAFGLMCLGFMYAAPNLLYFLLLFILSGVSAATYTTLEKAYAAYLLPSEVRGTGYGILNTVDGVGDFISSFVVGMLWTAISPNVAFAYGAVLAFISAMLLGLLRNLK